MNKNEIQLLETLKASKNIVLVGENEYVGSDIISSLASQAGYETIDVTNLGTATLSAEGGITISRRYDPQGEYIGKSFPDQWVKNLENNPDRKFVVVLNYADPIYVYDKENYLPWLHSILNHSICGDYFDNYIVIALVWSQDNLGQLSECFDETIVWSSDWNTYFNDLHKEYDSIYGKDLIDCIRKLTPYLISPSIIKEKLLYRIDIKAKGNEYNLKTWRDTSINNLIRDCLKDEYKDYESKIELKYSVDQLLFFIMDYLDKRACSWVKE